jgi:hypothetical protein
MPNVEEHEKEIIFYIFDVHPKGSITFFELLQALI